MSQKIPHSIQEKFPAGIDTGSIVKMASCTFFSKNGLILIPASVTCHRNAITSQAQMLKYPSETHPQSQEIADGEGSWQRFLKTHMTTELSSPLTEEERLWEELENRAWNGFDSPHFKTCKSHTDIGITLLQSEDVLQCLLNPYSYIFPLFTV